MELHELIRDIKTDFRLSMNGLASQAMRERGLAYKLNFGIEVPRLKEIVARYPKDHALAQALWKEDVRESKILAAMLQPVDSFCPEIADIWVEDMRYPEIAELTCQYLFQHLPYAPAKAFEWIADEREYFAACGYLVLTRLFMRGATPNDRAAHEYLDQVATVLQGEPSFVRRTAHTSLVRYAQLGDDEARAALSAIEPLRTADDESRRALYEQVRIEVE